MDFGGGPPINPVLPGFNPDPSILRVRDDYYIATSSFEWFPGVPIYHSRDLCHWRLLSYALTRPSQLELLGVHDSGGIYAPCLSYCDGLYYLVYTIVKSAGWGFMDSHNYMVTAGHPAETWSEPRYLDSNAFDPSLFHDRDGRSWYLKVLSDFRPRKNNDFAGITLQEFDRSSERLVGSIITIFEGTHLGFTEGPHLYRHGDYYYLITAEGGTGYGHAVTVARSPELTGPYEVDPQNPILTAAQDETLPLQKTGHASLTETPSGEPYIAYLCSRPLAPGGRCLLGRETAVQKCCWTKDGWLRLAGCTTSPAVHIARPDLPPHPFPMPSERDDFDAHELAPFWNTPRAPADASWISLRKRPGWLQLRGRESLHSRFSQSLVARRITDYAFEAETLLEFQPRDFQEMAGLVCYYGNSHFYYLCVTHDESVGRVAAVYACTGRGLFEPFGVVYELNSFGATGLRVTLADEQFRFACSQDGEQWRDLGSGLNALDLVTEPVPGIAFTGTFVGICTQDLRNADALAYFDYFSYRKTEKEQT